MKKRMLTLASVLLAAGLPFQVWGGNCESSDPPDTLCTLHVDEIRPTQFAVGSIAVNCRADELSARSKRRLKKYLESEKRQVPAVVGPDGDFYITDRHHLTTALHRAKSPNWRNKQKVLQIKILDNYTTKKVTWGEFWNDMKKQNRSYNFDNKGIPDMNFALIPEDVGGLLNDPYRTLSRWVRESCGYVKAGKEQCENIRTDHEHKAPFFMEFYWGDFFRKHLPLPTADLEVCKAIPYSPTCLSDEVGQLKDIYDKAMELAASSKAKTFFEDQELNPWDYGYNPSGEHLKLEWSGDKNACEVVVPQ